TVWSPCVLAIDSPSGECATAIVLLGAGENGTYRPATLLTASASPHRPSASVADVHGVDVVAASLSTERVVVVARVDDDGAFTTTRRGPACPPPISRARAISNTFSRSTSRPIDVARVIASDARRATRRARAAATRVDAECRVD
ncbi:hypothetical protein BE221DRAFT_80577, partial [Ostreococcus tauri]